MDRSLIHQARAYGEYFRRVISKEKVFDDSHLERFKGNGPRMPMATAAKAHSGL